MDFLSVNNLYKAQAGRPVVQGVSFRLEAGHKLAIVGATGSGKSTLLKMIGGLIQPDGGETLFRGKRVRGPLEVLIPGAPGIAYLSQHFELRNHYRVEEMLEMASKMTDEEASAIYTLCRIDHLLKRRTDQLSGGEKQRVALAAAMVTGPVLCLLDEPFSNLDRIHAHILRQVLEEAAAQRRLTFLLVSHEPADALSWADEILVMQDGHIIQRGTPRELYTRPQSAYVGGLFGHYNLVTPEQQVVLQPLGFIPQPARLLFLRPEALRPAGPQDAQVISVQVTQVFYYGSHYQLQVQTGSLSLQLRLGDTTLQAGDTLLLAADPGSAWYISE